MHHSPIFRVYIIVVDGCTAGLERAIEYKTKLRYKNQAQKVIEQEGGSGQNDGKNKDLQKGEKKVSSKVKKEDIAPIKSKQQLVKQKIKDKSDTGQIIEEQVIPEPRYTTDPDDAPDIPNYPNLFLVITGLGNDIQTLIFLQQQLLKINCRINALVNIRPVPLIPHSFITLLSYIKQPKLFNQIQPNQIKDKINEKDFKGGKNEGLDKKGSGQTQSGKVNKSSKDKKAGKEDSFDLLKKTNSIYIISSFAAALLEQGVPDPSIMGHGVFDEIGQVPNQLSLYDQIMLTRYQLVDGPGSVLKGIILLDLLSGVPFYPQVHIPSISIHQQTQNQELQTTQPIASPKGPHIDTFEETFDAFQTLIKLAPQFTSLEKEPFSEQPMDQIIKQTLLSPSLQNIFPLPPPPQYPSTSIKQIPINYISPFNPNKLYLPSHSPFIIQSSDPNSQSNVNSKEQIELVKKSGFNYEIVSNSQQPVPPLNFFTPNPILYIPKDGQTLLREIHLIISFHVHCQCLYELWINQMPKQVIDNKVPYELFISRENRWLRFQFDDP
ncbi:MAG: hypothetical protein EZS28_008415 [Streblomastix strix]|uniref:Uncharacterized protein n=1 Tax=Streblomastix strix TaxID=222440 RepID=A0A5J4WMP2_9EUKA|nr:MAG: hypothetical protein EZS28_008415 [Streblomastix strix]